jgi:hypothetical protein
VQDNLNTHAKASLYEAFPPAEARREGFVQLLVQPAGSPDPYRAPIMR